MEPLDSEDSSLIIQTLQKLRKTKLMRDQPENNWLDIYIYITFMLSCITPIFRSLFFILDSSGGASQSLLSKKKNYLPAKTHLEQDKNKAVMNVEQTPGWYNCH